MRDEWCWITISYFKGYLGVLGNYVIIKKNKKHSIRKLDAAIFFPQITMETVEASEHQGQSLNKTDKFLFSHYR